MTEQKRAKLAIVGCGGFSGNSIYPNVSALRCIDLVAACDLVREKAERFARNFGAQRVYTDLDAMLDAEEIDGAFVIGPAPMQYETAPRVLERGIPVYVEKPSANESGQAKEMAELADAKGTWGQVGFMKRFAHVYLMAKSIMARPDFGAPRLLKIKFAQGPYPQLWGIDTPRRSMLIGQLCHIFDLTRFLGGEVRTVQALYHEATDTQFAFAVNLCFESGAIGQLDLNSLAHRAAFRDIEEVAEIVALEQNIRCEDMMRLSWQGREDFSDTVPSTGRYVSRYEPSWTGLRSLESYGYKGEVEHFALRCLGGENKAADLWDSYEALRIGEAVHESAMNGGKVVTLE